MAPDASCAPVERASRCHVLRGAAPWAHSRRTFPTGAVDARARPAAAEVTVGGWSWARIDHTGRPDRHTTHRTAACSPHLDRRPFPSPAAPMGTGDKAAILPEIPRRRECRGTGGRPPRTRT